MQIFDQGNFQRILIALLDALGQCDLLLRSEEVHFPDLLEILIEGFIFACVRLLRQF